MVPYLLGRVQHLSYLCSRSMWILAVKDEAESYQSWILPQNKVYLGGLTCIYIICCRYWLYDSVLMFCYFVCVMAYIVILAWRSGGDTWLQKRDRPMEWSQLFCQSLMNNGVLES